MIIRGQPDILRGPRGLNGVHGLGLTPLLEEPDRSDAYTRFLPENGGLGIDALYQQIRDFITTPGRTQAEIEQAKIASGVSDADVYKALRNYEFPAVTDIFSPVITPLSEAYLRFLPENGGQGLDVLYKEIRDFLATNPTQAELEQAMRASGVGHGDIDNAFAQQPPELTDAQVRAALEFEAQAAAFSRVEQQPTGLAPIPDSSLRNREIVDYVTTHSDAEILAAMATTGVTQSDIIRAFASFDPTMPNGQSPAYARSLPENGGGGIANFYKEINDFVNTHSFYEVLSQMFRSEVSRADVEAANAYAFSKSPAGGGSGEAEALAAAAEAEARRIAALREAEKFEGAYEREARRIAEREAQRIADLLEANKPVDETGRYRARLEQLRLEALAAAAEAAAQAAIAAQAAQAQQALEATLAAKAAAAAAAAAQAVAAAVGDAASAAAAAKATAAANAAAATAATAAAVMIAKTPGESAAYTRFLPENGGKGITALYKEISDFVAVSSNAEIKTAMTASGVSEVDVIKALQVFPNKVVTQPAKSTGFTLPLVVSAIAAFFVLG